MTTSNDRSSLSPPYRPSWVDRLSARLSHQIVPPAVFYVGLGAMLALVVTVFQWLAGDMAIGAINFFQVWLALSIGLVLWFIQHLDGTAQKALSQSKPALTVDDATYSDLLYRLTHLPARHTLLASLAGGCLSVLPFFLIVRTATGGVVPATQVSAQPTALTPTFLLLFALWSCFGALVYHTIHQLRLIGHIYGQHIRIDLFDLGPLYAFSGVTLRTAVGLFVYIYLWFSVTPALLAMWIPIVLGAGMTLLAVATFFLPLLGLHNRLATEKERLLGENGRRIHIVLADLYEVIDNDPAAQTGSLKENLSALETHRNLLSTIPTWPWQPDTFRLLLTTLLLPLIIFVVQLIIQRFFVP